MRSGSIQIELVPLPCGSEAFENADEEVFSVYVCWALFQNEKGTFGFLESQLYSDCI